MMLIRIVAVGAAVFVLSGSVSVVSAQTTIISSCVTSKTGSVRIVGATDTCKNGEIPMTWNQQGPQGPAGPAGPTGATGPQGPAGTSPFSLTAVANNLTLGAGESTTIWAGCQNGTHVILSGTVAQWPPLNVFPPELVVTSIPSARVWGFYFQNTGAASITVGWATFVICTPMPS